MPDTIHRMAEQPTRERILNAAMTLFGERGYRATTIGDIEAAAGLVPRRGALYRHYESKEAVFRAAVMRYSQKFGTIEARWDRIDYTRPRDTLAASAAFTLEGLRAEADLFRIMQRDGHDFPDLVEHVHHELIARGYDFVIELFRRILAAHGRNDDDVVPLAAIALGSLVHFREDEAIYAKTPANATEDDFIRVWADTWTNVLTTPLP